MIRPPFVEPISVGPGQVLGGKYRVEKIIGSGGMGIVLAARHVTMNHLVAIKVLNLEADIEGEADRQDAIARFLREARATARIDSDHVVRVMDVASLDDGTPYMVMEFMEGDDFRKILYQRGQLPIAEAVAYTLEACEGLSEAHAAGIVHRDLKPSNLFLAKKPNGTKVVKVLDFGISKVSARAGEVALTTTNSLMGSPMYMAPEQMRQSRTVDSRADVWSLGLILYELLAGETAFSGETVPEVCVAVMSAEPRAISDFRGDVPQELQAILVKCMAKERTDRYATMAALARDLARFADESARVHADRASAALKAARTRMETDPEVDPPLSTERRAKRGVTPPPSKPSASPRDPETLKSWSTGRLSANASRRNAWVAIAALACAVALGIGVKLSQSTSSTPVVAAPRTPATPSATIVPDPTPMPIPAPSSVDLPSIPFDSLPPATRDAGAPRAPRPPSPTVTQTPIAPSATPPKKDDWKWGDRN